MLDENLPTFFIKSSSETPLSSTIYLSQNGSELQPEYTLRRPDPKAPASQNRYGVALYDSYNPEVLYAEVLVEPEWTQPTLSQAEIRAQNGISPPPVPIVPNNFTIQLYNPDQQVVVRQIAGSWNSSAHWEFEMPQSTFRIPSASALDRSQSDPAVSDITPKVTFKWKRDGKLSKDISCALVGKSTDGRKNKEPDIIVAMFKGGKDLTIYQPNMHRVDVEDVKGLEVVFILSAAVIKDIFFNASRDMFNISPTSVAANTKRKNSGPPVLGIGRTTTTPPVMSGATMSGAIQSSRPLQNIPASQIPQNNSRPQQSGPRPPPADARTQWEIDAETARLKALVEAEEKERERQEKLEEKRIKKMLEAEEKEQRRRDAEVAKETERLRKQYGVTGMDTGPRVQFTPPAIPPRPQQPYHQPHSSYSGPPSRPQALPQHQSAPHSLPAPVVRPQSTPHTHPTSGPFGCSTINGLWGGPQRPATNSNSPYLQAPGQGAATSSGFFGLGGNAGKKVAKKRSVFF